MPDGTPRDGGLPAVGPLTREVRERMKTASDSAGRLRRAWNDVSNYVWGVDPSEEDEEGDPVIRDSLIDALGMAAIEVKGSNIAIDGDGLYVRRQASKGSEWRTVEQASLADLRAATEELDPFLADVISNIERELPKVEHANIKAASVIEKGDWRPSPQP